MSLMDLSILSDSALAQEIRRRRQLHQEWLEIYRRDCIPFAHGMRLFGKIYNDLMKPKDPFQFVSLLAGSGMVSVRRNQMLVDLAELIRKDPSNKACILEGKGDDCKPEIKKGLKRVLDQFGDLAWEKGRLGEDRDRLLKLVLQMASLPESGEHPQEPEIQENWKRTSYLVLTKSRSLMPLNSSIWPGPAIG